MRAQQHGVKGTRRALLMQSAGASKKNVPVRSPPYPHQDERVGRLTVQVRFVVLLQRCPVIQVGPCRGHIQALLLRHAAGSVRCGGGLWVAALRAHATRGGGGVGGGPAPACPSGGAGAEGRLCLVQTDCLVAPASRADGGQGHQSMPGPEPSCPSSQQKLGLPVAGLSRMPERPGQG